MKKRSFRSTFVSVILVITVAISIVNLAVYGINIKKIRQVEVLKMKTAGERIDDMITISLNNIKGLKQICCTDNYARNILLKNNEKKYIGTKFENQNYMDNALKHIASMDTLILRATIVNKYGKTTTGPETNGTYVWMETDNWKRWEEKLMFGPYIHHLGCVYGHYLPVLREVSRYLGIHFDNAHEQGIYSL